MKPITDMEFYQLTTFVRQRYGVDLEKKRTLLEARLHPDMRKQGYTSYAAYIKEVTGNPDGEECQRMINSLTTNYTFFFREARSFDYLFKYALPKYRPEAGKPLILWCAACATGEEAYSLSMVLSHYMLPDGAPLSYQILATDINSDALDAAERGIYPEAALGFIPREYHRFVQRNRDSITICKPVADAILWKKENLLLCNHQATMDVIFCRNAMIYFGKKEREQLIVSLHDALKPGGYLFISGAECIDLNQRLFKRIEPAVYQKWTLPDSR